LPIQENLQEITVWYRGVVEGRLARQIANSLADAAQSEGKYVQAFDNYVDLPDRVYVPCRSYARICPEPIAEPYLYENHNPSIVICTDAALVEGCNVLKGLEPGGSLIVNTNRDPDLILNLLQDLPSRARLQKVATLDAGSAHQPYTPQSGIEGATEKAATMRTASLLLGAVAKVTEVVRLESLLECIADKEAVHAGYEGVKEKLNPEFDPDAPAEEVAEFGYRGKVDLIVPAPPPSGVQQGHITGNYRIFRPVVDHDICTACRICWVSCPDSCITVVDDADEKVRINLTYCKGCGICWEVCPLNCIEPREETDFTGGVVRITY
jgi:2-oxoacid:acceptor oxidoreductase delta subunit (pyruvate/2-ketoisovalerate family)